MKGNVIETIIGAVILLVAFGFVSYAYRTAGNSTQNGYVIDARFDRVDGLTLGADVRLSGIKIGTVTEMTLDPESYEAKIKMTIDPEVKLYGGTTAKITSAGLLGNQYISLDPGGSFDALANGGEISDTTGSIDLFGLISKFIFSGSSSDAGGDSPRK